MSHFPVETLSRKVTRLNLIEIKRNDKNSIGDNAKTSAISLLRLEHLTKVSDSNKNTEFFNNQISSPQNNIKSIIIPPSLLIKKKILPPTSINFEKCEDLKDEKLEKKKEEGTKLGKQKRQQQHQQEQQQPQREEQQREQQGIEFYSDFENKISDEHFSKTQLGKYAIKLNIPKSQFSLISKYISEKYKTPYENKIFKNEVKTRIVNINDCNAFSVYSLARNRPSAFSFENARPLR